MLKTIATLVASDQERGRHVTGSIAVPRTQPMMARDPAALQLRLLQTVVEVAGEQNSTLVMPVPVELLRFFEKTTPAGPAAELSPSLADFGDAEVAKAEAAIEGRPSAAGPDAIPPVEAIAIPPVEAPDIKVPEITADTEQAERP